MAMAAARLIAVVTTSWTKETTAEARKENMVRTNRVWGKKFYVVLRTIRLVCFGSVA